MYWVSFDLQGIILQVLKTMTCSDMRETHSPVSVISVLGEQLIAM